MSARDPSAAYSLADVCVILGVDRRWLARRIRDGALETMKGRIELGTLRRFVRSHPREFQGRTVDMVAFVDLLAGVIPPLRG